MLIIEHILFDQCFSIRFLINLLIFKIIIDIEVKILKHKSVWKIYIKEAYIMM